MLYHKRGGGGAKLRNAHLNHQLVRNCIRNQMLHLLNTTHLSILEKVLSYSLYIYVCVYIDFFSI